MEPVLGKPPFGKGEIMRGNLKHEGRQGFVQETFTDSELVSRSVDNFA